MKVYVDNKPLQLRPKNAIGKGGEADVYRFGRKHALKLFKQPDHPDYRPFPEQAQAACARLDELQTKLPQFPDLGRPEILSPDELVTDGGGRGGRILGYTMPLVRDAMPILRLGERRAREQGIAAAAVLSVFRDLHAGVELLHRRGIVIGDFNDTNVLVTGLDGAGCHGGIRIWLIDTDSYQFGGFLCRVFSERFLDPLLCDEAAGLMPARPFQEDSDWYAFSVMLLRSLLLTDAYGGIHKPAGKGNAKIPASQRPLRRITVFHPEVKYPKPAYPREILPDDWLDYFDRVLHHDQRGSFPLRLLESLRFTTCPACGLEHARRGCPLCQTQLAMAPPAETVRGTVRCIRLLDVSGGRVVAFAAGRRPRWLVLQAGKYLREDGRQVLAGAGRRLSAAVLGDVSLFAGSDRLVTIRDGETRCLGVDRADGRPAWAVNSRHLFRIENGRLVREETLGPKLIGEVLPGQTRFWVGETFGFGVYRAGRLSVAFVFEAAGLGLNDQVELPPLGGRWIDASCRFTSRHAWLAVTAEDAGRTVCRFVVIARDGSVEAVRKANAEEAAGAHGACAVDSSLLIPGDQGILRLGLVGGQLIETGSFPDTEPFVDSACQLHAASKGLYVVSAERVDRLVLER